MDIVPTQLLDAFSRGGGVVFVGAGLSMAAGYPDWNTLMRPLREELDECPPNSSNPDIAQLYELKVGRGFVMQRLRRQLQCPDAGPTEAHRALLRLPLQRLYTSNFDDLLEQTAREFRRGLDVVVNGADLSILEADRLHLIKIHGDLAQPDSVTITADDYELFASRKPPLSNLLKADLQTRVVLFMGYSFSDDNLKLILAQARQEGGSTPRNRFALLFDPSPTTEAMLRHKGVIPVPLALDAGQDRIATLAEWLNRFADQVAQSLRPDAPPARLATQRTHNLPPAPIGFIGRDQETAEVVLALSSRYPLVSIEGFAGVGKTSLAIQVGYACALLGGTRSPDAILFDYVVWVSAEDNPDQPEWLDDVLNAIANTTGWIAISQLSSADLDKKINQVELLLQSFRILLIIDNLETVHDEDLIIWMQAVPAPSKVLVTTRGTQLNQKAYAVPLGGLRKAPAMDLLRGQAKQLGIVPAPSDGQLQNLAGVTGRNPQAMRLALGLVQARVPIDQVINELEGATSSSNGVDSLFAEIFESSWRVMDPPARAVLLATPLFLGVGSINRDALIATAGLAQRPFYARAAISECVRLGLLGLNRDDREKGEIQRFIVHPMTRSFARAQWTLSPKFETEARARLITYYLELVRRSVVRTKPEPRYWNALVGDGMLKVDPEWPSILELMRWCDETGNVDALFDFTLMLVHYMDSRFFNNDRLHFVGRCVEIAKESGRRYLEALLRIDALGWTYAEESHFADAVHEIQRGLVIAEELPDAGDLRMLARAWLGRIEAEQEHWSEARVFIDEALSLQVSPWIACRVLMAKGDIELKTGQVEAALKSYQSAAAASASYGDEGRGYQTKPRIGLAYLALGDSARAGLVFEELANFEDMQIAKLYGEYGLAMVAYQKGEAKGAGALVDAVRERLLRRTSSNLLLNMTQRLQADMESRRPPSN